MNKSSDHDASLEALPVRAAEMAVAVGEMAAASSFVIATRMAMIGAAMANPLSGDYRELGRMMPEKMFAMSYSGMALFAGFTAIQRDLAAQMSDLAQLATGGVPTPARLSALADASGRRGSRALMWPVVTGAAAIRPLHKAVTANARRLSETPRQAA